jgi:hypothetical protein
MSPATATNTNVDATSLTLVGTNAHPAAALAEFCAEHDCSVREQERYQSNPEGILLH